MAYYRVTKKQSGGGSGAIVPTFTETVLVDNSALNTSFTFSSDYHNYDFIRIKLYNSSYTRYSYLLTTPSSIDATFDITTVLLVNEYNTNQACNYSESGLTWTRTWNRNCNIYEIVGLTCTNATVNETEIYKAISYSGTAVSITTQEDLMGYDWIIFTANDSAYDEVMFCPNMFVPSASILNANLYENQKSKYDFCVYGNNGARTVWIDNHTISADAYAYVIGINFT